MKFQFFRSIQVRFQWKRKGFSENSVNLYKEYTYLKSKELEESPRFWVMSWQPFQLPWSASLCLLG